MTPEKLKTWKGCSWKSYGLGEKMHVEERNMYSILIQEFWSFKVSFVEIVGHLSWFCSVGSKLTLCIPSHKTCIFCLPQSER